MQAKRLAIPHIVMIVSLVLMSAFLRSYLLSKQSLWFDEAFTYTMVNRDLWHALAAEVNNPPVYTVLLFYWTKVFGYTETGLRSLSVVASVASIILFIPIARKFLSDAALTLLLLFLAVSPFHIYYAQEARCFALLNCWLLAMVYFCQLFTEKPSWKTGFAYVLFAVLALYTHFISVFYIATAFLYASTKLYEQRSALTKLIVCNAITVLLFAPWLINMLKAAGGGGQLRKYLLLKLPQTFVSFLFGDTLLPLDQASLSDPNLYLRTYALEITLAGAVGVILAIVLSYFLIKSKDQTKLFFTAFAFVPVGMVFLISFKLMMLDERYVQTSSFFLYGLIASAVFYAVQKGGLLKAFSVIAVVGIFFLQLASVNNYFYDDRYGKEQWRNVVNDIEDEVATDSLVVFDVGYLDIAYQYYQSKSVESLRAVQNYAEPVSPPFSWQDKLMQYDSLVLIRSHFENDSVLDAIKHNFIIDKQRYYPNGRGISVYFMKRSDV